MTTIAFDGKLLVADTLCCWGNIKEDRIATKLGYRGGRFYAVAGLDGLLDTLMKWHDAGADSGKMPFLDGGARDTGWQLAVVYRATLGGVVCRYYDNDQPLGSALPPKWAIGSGKQFALGAMAVGATALDAVMAARTLDTTTGGPLQWFDTNAPIKRGRTPTLYNSKEPL